MAESANNFEIQKRDRDDIGCIYLHGCLDAHTAPELEKAIQDYLDNGQNKILINLKDLEYISSAGLGVFMAFIEDLRESGGDIKLAELKSKVYSVFDLLGFPMLFDIEKDENAAIAQFKKEEDKTDE